VASRFTVLGEGVASQTADLAADVRAGLAERPRRLACRWFYDAAGARLFEEICALPEYYLTRAEHEILATHRADVVAALEPGTSLLELGSGNAEKTRILIEELLRRDRRLVYVPVDISRPTLEEAGRELVARYPGLEVRAIAAEYHEGLRRLGQAGQEGPRLVLWLGSNVGNLDRDEAARFLTRLRELSSPRDRLLIGIDLRKDARTLVAAYDDAQGVTARFNLNLLARINAELGGDFDPGAFRHRATYDDQAGRIQMHLVSLRPQRVTIRALGLVVDFAEGEAIHTEDSYKYSLAEIAALAGASGFRIDRQWLDSGRRFALSLLALA
jgi:L-histidine N-alpha-methyltransferase